MIDKRVAGVEVRPGTGAAPATPKPNANESTLLAVDRTRLAHERTLMAWVRTATSMISFGFSIYKFFEGRPVRERRLEFITQLLDARNFAMLMIGVALIALLLAAVEHHREVTRLRTRYGETAVPRSNAMLVAALVAGFGLAAFLAVILG
jgi:putative membrane protein